MTARRAPRAPAFLAGLAVVALAVAGCGVPTGSEVQQVAPGPGAPQQLPRRGVQPPEANDATTHQEQVDNFLQAAAGDPATAVDRVREFIRSADRPSWDPDQQVRVVRLLDDPFFSDHPDGGWQVELKVLPIGDLHPEGYLDALTAAEPVDYRFRVVTTESGGPLEADEDAPGLQLRIAEPPPQVLMADTALDDPNYFYPNPIYFWDADATALVPDLRWLPLADESVERQPWRVLQWLLTGPAPSLPRAQGLPVGTEPIGFPSWDEERDRLVVNLNAAAVETQSEQPVRDLATQLAWSVRTLQPPGGTAELELRIDGKPQEVTAQPRPRWEQARFAVLDGVVRQVATDESDPAPPAVLSGEINSGLRRAALADDGEIAALVRERPDGRQELSVARVRDEAEPVEEPAGLVAQELGQPVWLSGAGAAIGLVVADGGLYQFAADPDGGRAAPVSVSGVTSPITDAAVSPDGRRLAFIAGDRLDQLYVATLRYDGESVTVQPVRALPTTLEALSAVAFSRETHLVVAGDQRDRTGLYELTVDGGIQEQLHDLGNLSVSGLVALPSDDPITPGTVMYEANGRTAYTYTLSGAPALIQAEALVDPPDGESGAPRAPSFLAGR